MGTSVTRPQVLIHTVATMTCGVVGLIWGSRRIANSHKGSMPGSVSLSVRFCGA